MFKNRFFLKNVATVVACFAVCAMMSCDGKDKDGNDGNENGAAKGGVDITFSLKAGANQNEVIVTCSPAMPKLFRDTGFGPAYFIVGLGNPFNMTKTGGTANNSDVYTSVNDNFWNAAGTEFTFIFSTLTVQSGNWEGTVTLKPINPEYVSDAAGLGIKSVKIGTNNPVAVKIH